MRSRLTLLRERYLSLAPNDLLRDATYRRLWGSILISSLGGQVTMLALPLTAAVLLHASPTQMGWLTTMELLPFIPQGSGSTGCASCRSMSLAS